MTSLPAQKTAVVVVMVEVVVGSNDKSGAPTDALRANKTKKCKSGVSAEKADAKKRILALKKPKNPPYLDCMRSQENLKSGHFWGAQAGNNS